MSKHKYLLKKKITVLNVCEVIRGGKLPEQLASTDHTRLRKNGLLSVERSAEKTGSFKSN